MFWAILPRIYPWASLPMGSSMKKKKRTEDKTASADVGYQPTEQEREALQKFGKVRATEQPSPRVKMGNDAEVATLSLDHPDGPTSVALLSQALGTTNGEFITGILRQLSEVVPQKGSRFEEDVNFLLSAISGMKPNDQLEAMLITQMATVHVAAMQLAGRLARVETIAQQDSNERAFNKLTRTFTTQMEALKRYRSGGEQKVTVQHVSVSEGGQAIVGNVTQANSEDKTERPKNEPLALTDARQVPMPILEEGAKGLSTLRPKGKNAKQS